MRFKLLAILIIFTQAAIGIAGNQPADVRLSELGKQSFIVNGLKITITKFWPGSLLSRGRIEVRVENTAGIPITFDPQRLSFVNKDSRQVSIQAWIHQGTRSTYNQGVHIVFEREIAPSAYIKEYYWLDGKVRLPARLFYGGKQLALIVK